MHLKKRANSMRVPLVTWGIRAIFAFEQRGGPMGASLRGLSYTAEELLRRR
jgi:hypothetical protein